MKLKRSSQENILNFFKLCFARQLLVCLLMPCLVNFSWHILHSVSDFSSLPLLFLFVFSESLEFTVTCPLFAVTVQWSTPNSFKKHKRQLNVKHLQKQIAFISQKKAHSIERRLKTRRWKGKHYQAQE